MVEIKVIKPTRFNMLHPLNVPDRYEVGETYALVLHGTVIRTLACVPSSSSRRGFDKCVGCPNFSDIEATICGSCHNDPITFINADGVLEGL
jgi:hypothetical protein